MRDNDDYLRLLRGEISSAEWVRLLKEQIAEERKLKLLEGPKR